MNFSSRHLLRSLRWKIPIVINCSSITYLKRLGTAYHSKQIATNATTTICYSYHTFQYVFLQEFKVPTLFATQIPRGHSITWITQNSERTNNKLFTECIGLGHININSCSSPSKVGDNMLLLCSRVQKQKLIQNKGQILIFSFLFHWPFI